MRGRKTADLSFMSKVNISLEESDWRRRLKEEAICVCGRRRVILHNNFSSLERENSKNHFLSCCSCSVLKCCNPKFTLLNSKLLNLNQRHHDHFWYAMPHTHTFLHIPRYQCWPSVSNNPLHCLQEASSPPSLLSPSSPHLLSFLWESFSS